MLTQPQHLFEIWEGRMAIDRTTLGGPIEAEFIHFEHRSSQHPLIEKVWRCRSERPDTFLSVAANSFEIAVTHLRGNRFITLRGPETKATAMDCPDDGEWTCIRFKAGTFMPRFLPGILRDHNDVTLPHATEESFWVNGSVVEYPDFENAEMFVDRLFQSGVLSRDPVVVESLKRRPTELSLRTAQRHFLRSVGVPFAMFRQIERARYATRLLRDGVSILEVIGRAGYFDQAHLTRALKRFIGETPSRIAEAQRQLSFLYKTDPETEGIFLTEAV